MLNNINKNSHINNRIYMKYYNSVHKRGYPDFNNEKYKKEYYEVNKELIEEYKKNKDYYFHRKRRGRPPSWKTEIDKESNILKKKQGNFKITFD